MPLGDPGRLGGLGELSRELRAIIMKGVLDPHRQYRLGESKGLGGPETPVARYRQGEANTGALVLGANEVAPPPVCRELLIVRLFTR